MIIGILAFVLFVGVCFLLVPKYSQLSADVGSGGGVVLHVMQVLRDWLPFWVAIPPLLAATLLFVWLRSSRVHKMSYRGLPRLWGWLPGVSRFAADQSCARLAELLALLVEHDVPLYEALRLAAQANGDRKLKSAARRLATAAEQGRPLTEETHATRRFPPFLRWALTSSAEAAGLARTLRLAAKTYRHRAEGRAEWLRVAIPMLTCVVLAGGVTLLYCLSIIGPFVRLIQDLS
jgi:type II secretory pathway component PulF